MKLIKIPFSAGGLGKAKGAEKAPNKILEQIKELYLSEDGVLPIIDVEEVRINQTNIEETNENIFNHAKKAITEFQKPIFLGGEHSITYSLVKAFAEVHKEKPGIIIFDAHPDCCSDFNLPTHEDLLLALVKENIIPKENIILVGIRNWHKDEYTFLKQNRIKYFTMKEISMESIQDVSDAVMVVAKNFKSLYLSIDIDVLDPAFAPGTGYIEPGGFTSRELIYFIHRLKRINNLKAADIVEVNPDKDINDITTKMAAKLAVELG